MSENDDRIRHFLKHNQVDPDKAMKKMIKDAQDWEPPRAEDIAPKMFDEHQQFTSTTAPVTRGVMEKLCDIRDASLSLQREQMVEPPYELCDGCGEKIYGGSHKEGNQRFTKCLHCGLYKISDRKSDA